MSLKHMQNKDSVWYLYSKVMLLLNTLCFLMGILMVCGFYALRSTSAYGFLMLVVFLGNIALAYKTENNKPLGYGYLILSFLFMFIIPVMNTLVSITPSNYSSQSILSIMAILGLFLYGGILAAGGLVKHSSNVTSERIETAAISKAFQAPLSKTMNEARIRKQSKHNRGSSIVHIVTILLSLILFSGLFLVVFLLRVRDVNGIIEAIIAEYALFYGIMFLSLGVFLRKIPFVHQHTVYQSVIQIAVTIIFLVCILPFATIPVLKKNAERNYIQAFGNKYLEESALQGNRYRQLPFSLTEYFFGILSGGYDVQENLLFYKGTEGVDSGLKLYYDVYTPVKDQDFSGGRPVLIRIHGGGWTIGDKGLGNFSQMNKYFASKGYVVFDIQYGLSNTEKLFDFVPVTENRVGNFTIDDMVRHIGIFMSYLVNHKEEYKVNLNSVFLSGGSAGGHLTLAAGLKNGAGNYDGDLNQEISIKGLIPFYPANGLASFVGVKGREEFIDVIPLINSYSPPCIIYQGSHDTFVDAAIPQRVRKAYLEAGNHQCAVLKMLFAGHGSDLYFAGYYNQVFLFYMERFLYQFR